MDWTNVLEIAIVLLIVFVSGVLLQLFRVLGSINKLIKEMRQEIIPSLNSLRTTIDAVNNELSRFDEIVGSVQEVTDKVSSTTRVAQEIISSPLIKIASFSFGAKKALSSLFKRKE